MSTRSLCNKSYNGITLFFFFFCQDEPHLINIFLSLRTLLIFYIKFKSLAKKKTLACSQSYVTYTYILARCGLTLKLACKNVVNFFFSKKKRWSNKHTHVSIRKKDVACSHVCFLSYMCGVI